jgi:NhaP-type Na+/H+ or K+/H+ antiporter
MTDLIPTLDLRDVFYSAIGLALLGLSFESAFSRHRLVNMPLFFIIAGVILAVLGLPTIDPRRAEVETAVIEHVSELIVIISLTGAGLAIDTRMTWKNWEAAFRLLAVAMPLTIAVVALAGVLWLGMSLAAAMLLAAALAPTDPVLARSVQVGPPGADETPMSLALTAEAGLNDGLAFPFVYLAIHAAAIGVSQMFQGETWFWTWLGFDFAYRVAMGVLAGVATGFAISKVVFSPIGDGAQGAWNAVLVILSATLISYGVAEALDGYGFLAVFCAVRAGRSNTRGTEHEGYERYVHHGAEQLEAILLALLLLWLGVFAASGALVGLRWQEVAFAAILILLLRPGVGWLALLGHRSRRMPRWAVAFFGIRGMGSVFYIAYAQNHAEFEDIDAIWRIAVVTIVGSILVHGYAANFLLSDESELEIGDVHPYREDGADDGERRAAE